MSVGEEMMIEDITKIQWIFITLIALLSISQTSKATFPEISFACQVIHPIKGEKLKLVQANTREEAIEIAQLKEDSKLQLLQVKQCVVIGEETFRDSSFQRDFDKTPR